GHWECTGSVNPQEISWRGVWSLWNVEAASSVKRVREESAEGILRAAMVPGTHTYRIYTPNAPHRRLTSAMDPFTFVISPQATKLTFDSNYAVMTQESNRFIVGRSGRSARTPMINVPIVEGMVTPVSINIWQINAPP